MKTHYVLHRLFLIFMFAVCALAVVLFVKQQASASLDSSGLTSTVNATVTAIRGVCSAVNGTSVYTEPTGALCSAGNQSMVEKTELGWVWKCLGINGGASASCSVTRIAQEAVIGSTVNNTAELVLTDTQTATTTAVSAPATTTNTTTKNTTTTTTNKAWSEDVSSNEKYDVTITVERPEPEIAAPIVKEGAPIENLSAIDDSVQQALVVEKSPVVIPSVVVEAKNLLQDNNPKIAGIIDETLKIEKVTFNKKENDTGNVLLAGKSQQNALVTIYIFSNDPIIITVRADADGNWNYELDKELVDGQHEAFVAMTDNAGKIISKSQPIAFVKTAQAASVIPMSELTANQSPIERSSQQYIFIAIAIMLVCLMIALMLIGFLTYKRNLDEGINQ